jgi:hypothetical protein
MMVRVAIALILLGSPVLAQPAARTPAEQEVQRVCRSDAISHCFFHVTDRERLAACFRTNFARMSPPCQTALRAADADRRQR